LISRDEIASVFANLEDIFKAHNEILTNLKKRVVDWETNPTMGDVFCDKLEFFRLYRPYVLMHPQMNVALGNILFRKPLFVISVNVRLPPFGLDSDGKLKILAMNRLGKSNTMAV